MENASKALIMAGGILIAILIISLGVYLFNSASILSSTYSDKLSQDELNKLNNKFLIYAKDLTPQQMVTIINLVNENNKKNINVEENQIIVIIDNKIIDTSTTSQDWKTVIMEQADVDNDPKYKFISVSYNEQSGRISQMAWKSTGSPISMEEIAVTCYHTWGEWTYTDDSKHQRTCRKCKQSQTQNHKWKDYTENGNTHKKTCSICNSIKDEQHDYTQYIDKNNGTHSRSCNKCSKIDTNSHEWDNWITINNQEHKRSCRLCSSKEQGTHIWIPATTEAPKTCQICGLTEGEPLPSKVAEILLNDITISSTNNTATITPTISPNSATNKEVTWSSGNTGIATVDENGTVKYVSPGIVTVTATAKDGSGVKGTSKVICMENSNRWVSLFNANCEEYGSTLRRSWSVDLSRSVKFNIQLNFWWKCILWLECISLSYSRWI